MSEHFMASTKVLNHWATYITAHTLHQRLANDTVTERNDDGFLIQHSIKNICDATE